MNNAKQHIRYNPGGDDLRGVFCLQMVESIEHQIVPIDLKSYSFLTGFFAFSSCNHIFECTLTIKNITASDISGELNINCKRSATSCDRLEFPRECIRANLSGLLYKRYDELTNLLIFAQNVSLNAMALTQLPTTSQMLLLNRLPKSKFSLFQVGNLLIGLFCEPEAGGFYLSM